MSSSTSSLTGEKIFDSAADLGRIKTHIGLIISIVVSVILIIVAIYIGSQSQRPFTTAFIEEATCETFVVPVRNNRNYDNDFKNVCTLKLLYEVNSIKYIENITTRSDIHYAPKQNIEIEYDPRNPKNFFIKNSDNATQSKILVVVAILITGVAFVVDHIAQKNKVFAAAQGASTVVNVFRL
jgi:hypothetical protein